MTTAKVERLLSLLNVLLGAARPLTSAELRRRVPGYPDDDVAFKRMFERDKSELRDMGVPVDPEPVPGTDPPATGYRVRLADYALQDPGLEPDELEALNFAAAVVGSSGGLGQQALFKLGGVAVDADQAAELPADPDLVAVFTGVIECRTVAFRYHDVERTVDPYRLEFLRGRWYLNGYDHLREEDRWYRLGRIQGAVSLVGEPGSFHRPEEAVPGLQLDPWVLGNVEDPVRAEVWFDPAVAAVVRAGLAEVEVLADDGSGLVVALTVTNREGFRSWLLSFLDRAEVIGPEDLRAEIVAWLAGVAEGAAGEVAP